MDSRTGIHAHLREMMGLQRLEFVKGVWYVFFRSFDANRSSLAYPIQCTSSGGSGGGSGSCSQETNCPTDTSGTGYEGRTNCINEMKPLAAPLRGSVACLTPAALSIRPTAGNQNLDATNIYGPMEAGFSSQQFPCLGNQTVSGGHDTKLAEQMVLAIDSCQGETITVLDYCGGHANPYHYHERMDCLYTSDNTTGHSTRVGTAIDGNGVYGHYIDGGVLPCDLDVCGGRVGITPDSGGIEVYYYMITSYAPFTIGCLGSEDGVTTVEECRALYDTCSDPPVPVTTLYGIGFYTLDCPCFDRNGSNTDLNDGIPGYLSPDEIAELPSVRCLDDSVQTTDVPSMTSTASATTVSPISSTDSSDITNTSDTNSSDTNTTTAASISSTVAPNNMSTASATTVAPISSTDSPNNNMSTASATTVTPIVSTDSPDSGTTASTTTVAPSTDSPDSDTTAMAPPITDSPTIITTAPADDDDENKASSGNNNTVLISIAVTVVVVTLLIVCVTCKCLKQNKRDGGLVFDNAASVGLREHFNQGVLMGPSSSYNNNQIGVATPLHEL